MQLMPGRTHIPQLALQHSSPSEHVTAPQGWPPVSGTHTGSPPITSQRVSGAHNTAAQGLGAGSQSHTSGELFQS